MRAIPDPGFPDDDGAPDPRAVQALTTYAGEPETRHAETLAVLQQTRLLVPVVAVLGEVAHDDRGLAHEKTSDMAAVLMRGRDGRTALLAFTSTEAMHRWDPQARPVPVPAAAAAAAAVQDGAAALLVDVAGPVLFVIEEDDLRSLAEGYTLADLGGRYGWVKHHPLRYRR